MINSKQGHILCSELKGDHKTALIEPHHMNTCRREIWTWVNFDQPAQLQQLVRVFKILQKESRSNTVYWHQTTKTPISLCGCTAYLCHCCLHSKKFFFHDAAQINIHVHTYTITEFIHAKPYFNMEVVPSGLIFTKNIYFFIHFNT